MSSLDVAFRSFSVLFHSADIGTDIWTGVEFIARGYLLWGILTLVLVVLSMAITAIVMCFDSNYNCRKKILFIICFPLVPLGNLIWDLKKTWQHYRSGRGASSYIGIPHVAAAGYAKLSEAFSEALPQSCIGTHIVFQTLFVPGVEDTVEWYQWLSLVLSISSLAFYIATNNPWEIESKWQKALVFLALLLVISSRLIIYATLGTLHSAMFLLPIVTELFSNMPLFYYCCNETIYVIAVFSTINIWFGIGCLFITAVPLVITVTALVIILIATPIQIWALRNYISDLFH